ncbi:MAG: D-aminoacyl-tRNA deacylase [Armatimonadota bacterium]
MRAVVQRVRRARVTVGDDAVGAIGPGLAVLVGFRSGDTEADAEYLLDKIIGLRIFEDENGKMNLGLRDVGGGLLLVPNFTLYGDCRKGRRPSFGHAAPPDEAEGLFQVVLERARGQLGQVEAGHFGARMQVEIENDGPVTLLLDSQRDF